MLYIYDLFIGEMKEIECNSWVFFPVLRIIFIYVYLRDTHLFVCDMFAPTQHIYLTCITSDILISGREDKEYSITCFQLDIMSLFRYKIIYNRYSLA